MVGVRLRIRLRDQAWGEGNLRRLELARLRLYLLQLHVLTMARLRRLELPRRRVRLALELTHLVRVRGTG